MDSGGIEVRPAVDYRLQVAYVDVIDACHLRCPTCPRGARIIQNTSRKMPLDEFRSVLDKLKAAGYAAIALFSWNEPFLNRTLQDYVAEVKARDLPCWISTTLSLRRIDNLEAVLRAGVTDLFISISGMEQAVHQINHVGGTIAYTLEHARSAAKIIRDHRLPTTAFLRFIRFSYNQEQIPAAKQFAAAAGLNFQIVEGAGENHLKGEGDNLHLNDELVSKIMLAGGRYASETKSCPLMFDQVTIDAAGVAYLCCAVPNINSFRVGKYLDIPDDELLRRRYAHAFCATCAAPRRERTDLDHRRLRLSV